MRIIVARRRIRGTLPHYEYRVFVPFDEISLERQDLLSTRSDYGFGAGPWARVFEVIAPMSYPRLRPGGERYRQSVAIETVAKRVGAAIVRHIHPEMTAAKVPVVFAGSGDHPDTTTVAELDELTGRFELYAKHRGAITADDLALSALDEARAA